MNDETLFANPYLTCDLCKQFVKGVKNLNTSGVATTSIPCGHVAGITSVCPSWGPVEGCECLGILGAVNHARPVG